MMVEVLAIQRPVCRLRFCISINVGTINVSRIVTWDSLQKQHSTDQPPPRKLCMDQQLASTQLVMKAHKESLGLKISLASVKICEK